jgi:hypothetical protein
MADIESQKNIDQDYDCKCFNYEIINVPSKIILAFIISLFFLGFSFTYMFLVQGSENIFIPIDTAIITFWLPSPLQNNVSRKDVLQNNQLIQHLIVKKKTESTPLMIPNQSDL